MSKEEVPTIVMSINCNLWNLKLLLPLADIYYVNYKHKILSDMKQNIEKVARIEKRVDCFQCDVLDGETVIHLDLITSNCR